MPKIKHYQKQCKDCDTCNISESIQILEYKNEKKTITKEEYENLMMMRHHLFIMSMMQR